MYEDMYKDYSNEEFPYNYPFSFRLKNKKYLEPYPPISAWWYYGETVNIELDLTDIDAFKDVEDISIFLQDKQLNASIYNFRKEIIDSKTFVSDDIEEDVIVYPIDRDTSLKVFTEGIYYLELTLDEVDENNEIISTKVIIDNDDYLIRVV